MDKEAADRALGSSTILPSPARFSKGENTGGNLPRVLPSAQERERKERGGWGRGAGREKKDLVLFERERSGFVRTGFYDNPLILILNNLKATNF
ncbi:hypothetical protein KFK09_000191 [Dendrobium nobile]|uniref:Uncharacterized protein n=1 Tax=Dendrobium nobile TaxID=94219 RepID=A0A8T3C7U6_DENNO|nr:hypothetical protein KFK09_000191 [Dendrobium nobile]